MLSGVKWLTNSVLGTTVVVSSRVDHQPPFFFLAFKIPRGRWAPTGFVFFVSEKCDGDGTLTHRYYHIA